MKETAASFARNVKWTRGSHRGGGEERGVTSKRVNLMHRRATTTTVQEEEEEEKDMDDYGPSVTQAVGGFEKENEDKWTRRDGRWLKIKSTSPVLNQGSHLENI